MAVVSVKFPGNLSQVSDLADLRALPSAYIQNGAYYLVTEPASQWLYDSGAAGADDGETIVKPDDRTNDQLGRWKPISNAGGGGSGNISVSSLGELKAASPDTLTVSLTEAGKEGLFVWTEGDFTGQADDINIVKQDDTSLSIGAWVRQKAQAISFQSPVAPQPLIRSADEKMGEIVTITDFAVADADRVAGVVTGTDISAQFQALIDTPAVRKIIVPQNARVRVDTSLNLRGDLEIELQQNAEIVGNVANDYVLKGFGTQTPIVNAASALKVNRAITRYDIDMQFTAAITTFDVGDLLLVTDVQGGFDTPTGVFNNQVGVVQRIAGDYAFFELPLVYPMATAANIAVAKLTGCRNIKITGRGKITNAGAAGGGIRFNGARDIVLDGIEVRDTNYIGISIETCWNTTANNVMTDNTGAAGLGFRASTYGIVNRFIGEKPRADEALTFYNGCSYFKVNSPRVVQFLAGNDPTGGNAGNCILVDLMCAYIDIISPMCIGSATYSIFFSQSTEYCTVNDFAISKADLAGIRSDASCKFITVGSGSVTDVVQTSDPFTGGNTAAIVISGGQGNCVAGHVSWSRIAGGRGVVDAQSTANKGHFFASKGGIDCNAPYMGWDVRGKTMGVTTGDFVAGATGTALQIGLSGTSGDVMGQIYVGQAGDTAFGDLRFQPFGGALGSGLLPTFADEAAASVGGLTQGRWYKSSDGIMRQKL